MDLDLVIINQPRVFPYRRGYQVAKRVVDVALCLLVMPLALPLLAICALAIRLDSPGPVLFVQERVGKGGRRFRMYKFRTMQHNLDDSYHRAFLKAFVNGQIGDDENGGAIYKPIQTSQVTRVGRILRKISLDELPQLINVLRGEMSLIGPRPNVLWEFEEYKGWHNERLEVLPGITGLAQVRGRSGLTFDSIVKYDIEYIERRSLALDLKILWWTLLSVCLGRGAE
ncbi:MAG: sugar transferase [Anaerolineales bacterium]|nr:MAG: sugar transferase [Anaerolineales bacterium]